MDKVKICQGERVREVVKEDVAHFLARGWKKKVARKKVASKTQEIKID